MSFLEMLDVVNEDLTHRGQEPDCVRSRLPRGHLRHVLDASSTANRTADERKVATCQTYMRSFRTARPSPSNRSAPAGVSRDQGFDRQPQRLRPDHPGRRFHLRQRPARRPTATPFRCPRQAADLAMDAAACIGCGACVAACKNASAMLFVAAKVSHLNLLPQGQPEKESAFSTWSGRWTRKALARAP
jgi:succinate dehydrogenase / fumarate reductase, iron-sulfur subunit